MTISVRDDITVFDNEDLTLAVRWTDEDGDPYLLTDALFQIRRSAFAADVLIEASVGDGITLADLDGGGWALVHVPLDDLPAFDYYGPAVYDFVVTRDLDGYTERLRHGFASLRRGVTREP